MDEVVDHFNRWLRTASTGCLFASRLVAAGRIAYERHDKPPDVDVLDASLDDYGRRGLTAIVLLPLLSSEEELVAALARLGEGTRWRTLDRGRRADGSVLVGLEWTTASGDVSDAMGFAPLPWMPVPRRAPYFAIALWPGGRRNAERGTPPTPRARGREVSFLDAEHGFAHGEYVATWEKTAARVGGLMKAPPDDAALYRRVAFVLRAPPG
ncbi:MAG: hypothetical protein KF773_29615 [Deltaproteobacteria bacterium]|nr:hypothetical protein [Deltaproteobacteria bacterium]